MVVIQSFFIREPQVVKHKNSIWKIKDANGDEKEGDDEICGVAVKLFQGDVYLVKSS